LFLVFVQALLVVLIIISKLLR